MTHEINMNNSHSIEVINPLNNIQLPRNYLVVPNSESDHDDSEENEYKTCMICYDEMKDVCLLRCNHIICLNCLVEWFKKKKNCPFCRIDISDIKI